MIKEKRNTELEERLGREILPFISPGMRAPLNKVIKNHAFGLEEIRFRANQPFMVRNSSEDWFLTGDGTLTEEKEGGILINQTEIIKMLEMMSENSVYAFLEEIKHGFLTLRGGHRVGIVGRVVVEGLGVKNIRDISGLNIRISREVYGCAKKVLPYVVKNRKEVYNALILSPPQCGKTTLLRDLARFISNGSKAHQLAGLQVGIVDERSEIAACYKGIPQNDLGVRTDVLDHCPKAIGMTMLLRSMSPHVIITDEIGHAGDKDAVLQLMNAGVKLITTAHGYNISELKTRKEVVSLMNEKIFERYVVLSNKNGPGTLEEIIDGQTMKPLYRRMEPCCLSVSGVSS